MVIGKIEKFIARQLRMGAAQPVPEHFGQRREPLAGKVVHADRRQLRHIIGNGEDLPQRQRRDVPVAAGEPHGARLRKIEFSSRSKLKRSISFH